MNNLSLIAIGSALAASVSFVSCSKHSNAKEAASPQMAANTTQTAPSQVASAPGPASLAMKFYGMTPHIGQMLAVNVLDSANDSMVIDTGLAAVPADSFEIRYGTKLMKGRSYIVDFFADLNKNGKYDKPPVDHSWKIPLSKVAGDTVLTFVHNTNFTDIGSPKIPAYLEKSAQSVASKSHEKMKPKKQRP